MPFAVIDFETANNSDLSICAVGVAVFDQGHMTDSYYSLVRPPKGSGWFDERFIAIHRITHEAVRSSPEFLAVASDVLSRLAAADMVLAHNAQFDMRKLYATAKHFGVEVPPFDYLCTYRLAEKLWPQLSNHQLQTVAAYAGHTFDHHNALADAEACGRIMVAMMTQKGVTEPRLLAEAVGLRLARMA
ncbi:MAG: 3'-5' exonuclease [Phycisphaerae bacterium]